MAKDVLKEHIPGIYEHGIVTDAVVSLSAPGLVSLTSSQLEEVHTSAQYELGTKGRDASGNEYLYMLGVASTEANDFVTYNHAYATTRLVSSAVGPVAIAKADIVAGMYGWYQVFGTGTGRNANTVSANAPLFIGAVTGSADDLVVTGDKISNAFSRSTQTVTGGGITVQIMYPYVDDRTT